MMKVQDECDRRMAENHRLRDENYLLTVVLDKAQAALLVAMNEKVSERLAEYLGDLSLAIRAHYIARTQLVREHCKKLDVNDDPNINTTDVSNASSSEGQSNG